MGNSGRLLNLLMGAVRDVGELMLFEDAGLGEGAASVAAIWRRGRREESS